MTEVDRYSPDSLGSKKKFLTEKLVPIAEVLASRKFNPIPFHDSFVQTTAGVCMPPFTEKEKPTTKKREFVRVDNNAEIALDYSLHTEHNEHPTIVIIPGITGLSTSPFSVGVANKAVHDGFNAVRVNLRSAGDAGSRSTTSFHAGQTEDIKEVFNELSSNGLTELYVVASSFGGNVLLKTIGEMGEEAKKIIRGTALVSPVVKLDDVVRNMSRFYERQILRTLKNRVKEKAKKDPKNWDISSLNKIKGIHQWESSYQIGPGPIRWDFTDLQQYYKNVSPLPYVGKIAIPTFIIHAEDDPIVSALPLGGEQFTNNPQIFVMKTLHGGHAGFVNVVKTGEDLDRHWAQNRVIEFFNLLQRSQRV
mgnify:CR=1 FL=1